MYLSQLVLNGGDSTAQRDFSNAHDLHRRIMQAFPDEQRDQPRADWNVLFRHEPDSDVILVQSAIEPDWSRLHQGYLAKAPITKPFDLDDSQLRAGRVVQFRLKANPSKRSKETGKTLGLFHQPEHLAWLERRAAQHGFTLLNVDTVPTPNVFGMKGKGTSPIRIISVLYQGVIRIDDPALFSTAIRQGIGRGRSYGCGLLSIARL
ncbi:type I-E CRISPR-associated protein Cas6/Cse3/CasE [Leptolyngbya sp. GB1-A1]|uniref:type I-E CRISPR-associated protein Cas6/Cse3/CasE n=1 Tax=Leptolyngbya sp. GB1-A1 TaxID=2933908 RepID=UPI003298EFC0